MISRLDLLKLALCDLVSGQSLQMPSDGSPPALIAGEELQARVTGHDWPLTALTMVGYDRLTSLEETIKHLVATKVPGDLIECGVWRGGASILMRAVLEEYGWDDREVWLADSFQGFREDEWLSQFEILRAPLGPVMEAFERFDLLERTNFLEGRVEDRLPELRGRQWALIRLDTDTHASITAGLENLYPYLSRRGAVIVDDYRIIQDVRQAVDDFRARNDIPGELELLDWNCCRWYKP